jgi:uncharacterized protein YjbI with pentapeptide repeats
MGFAKNRQFAPAAQTLANPPQSPNKKSNSPPRPTPTDPYIYKKSMEPIRVHQSKTRIEATEFDLEESRFNKGSMRNSRFDNIMLSGTVFEDCSLTNSKFINCDLTGVELTDCNITGMTINGISVTDLLARR